ncbi:MAG TPA: hypothetical protein DD490_32845 [Acidobacteria bacterium]|nr:hypothetical protein [Acidobacteriota bacterium]
MPEKALMTVQAEGGPPTLEAAARQLGVAVEAVDATFGVVTIDPKSGLYSVQVDAAQLPLEAAPGGAYRGPFSDPCIEALGQPQEGVIDDSPKRSRGSTNDGDGDG